MNIKAGDLVKLNPEKRSAFTNYGWEHYGNRPLKVISSNDVSVEIPSRNGGSTINLNVEHVVRIESVLVGIEDLI